VSKICLALPIFILLFLSIRVTFASDCHSFLFLFLFLLFLFLLVSFWDDYNTIAKSRFGRGVFDVEDLA
jgi:hypothetical protein